MNEQIIIVKKKPMATGESDNDYFGIECSKLGNSDCFRDCDNCCDRWTIKKVRYET